MKFINSEEKNTHEDLLPISLLLSVPHSGIVSKWGLGSRVITWAKSEHNQNRPCKLLRKRPHVRVWDTACQYIQQINSSSITEMTYQFFQWTWWSRWSQAKVHVWKLYISLHIKTTFSIRRFKSSIHKQKDGGKNGDTHSTQQINLGNKFITWSLIN